MRRGPAASREGRAFTRPSRTTAAPLRQPPLRATCCGRGTAGACVERVCAGGRVERPEAAADGAVLRAGAAAVPVARVREAGAAAAARGAAAVGRVAADLVAANLVEASLVEASLVEAGLVEAGLVAAGGAVETA